MIIEKNRILKGSGYCQGVKDKPHSGYQRHVLFIYTHPICHSLPVSDFQTHKGILQKVK